MFEAFTTSKGQRGTGLGLAVTRKIIEEHGGRIEIESDPPNGTTFVIILPSDQGAISAADTKLPRPRAAGDFDDGFG